MKISKNSLYTYSNENSFLFIIYILYTLFSILLFKFHFFSSFFRSIFFFPRKFSKIFLEIHIPVMRILLPPLYIHFSRYSQLFKQPSCFFTYFSFSFVLSILILFSHARAKGFSRIFIVRRQNFSLLHNDY